MNMLIDKVVLFMVCAAHFIQNTHPEGIIPVILVVVIISAAVSYFDRLRFTIAAFFFYIAVCIFFPFFCFFLPLLCYDVFPDTRRPVFLLGLVPLAIGRDMFFSVSGAMILLYGLLSYILKVRTASLHELRRELYRLLDSLKETSLQLEAQNKYLIEKQDYEINLATLNERNRISRDIHDNVGHLLSSSILQVGAILATVGDDALKERIRTLKDTLTNAMDSIRKSVHNLHDESIDLRVEIESLIRAFTFCPVHFEYDVNSSLDAELKYCFIAVAKEALNNISKHSNATSASIAVREHPAFIQLVIQDNGTVRRGGNEGGIGLKSISDRVAALNGNINIGSDKGFRIFISVPRSK